MRINYGVVHQLCYLNYLMLNIKYFYFNKRKILEIPKDYIVLMSVVLKLDRPRFKF